MKGYREKDVVSNAWIAGSKDIEFTENVNESNLILYFIMCLGLQIIRKRCNEQWVDNVGSFHELFLYLYTRLDYLNRSMKLIQLQVI